jgi:hypothetical protein
MTTNMRLTIMCGAFALAMAACDQPPEEEAPPATEAPPSSEAPPATEAPPAKDAPAAVDKVQQAFSRNCLQIGWTTTNGRYIHGYGSVSCPGAATLYIKKKTQAGPFNWWSDVASVVIPGPGRNYYVTYDCKGTGRHTFNAQIRSWNDEQWPIEKSSNEVTVSCP